MPIERISLIWEHFEVIKNDKNNAICKLCRVKGLSKKEYTVAKNAGTTNLWTHLKNKHLQEHKLLKEKEDQNTTKTIHIILNHQKFNNKRLI